MSSSSPISPTATASSATTTFSTPFSTVQSIHATLQETFRSKRTKSLAWRKWQLKQLWWLLTDNTAAIITALQQDLGRHPIEATSSDITTLRTDLQAVLSSLERFAKDEPVSNAGFLFKYLLGAKIRKEPLGVALVIGAWNFPFLLALQPVISAISAGNCVILKPSELAPASQELIVRLFDKYMDPTAIRVVTANGPETQRILEGLKFDHVFFTGSTKVGKIVSQAAAKTLTPVVLELGGQDPVVVGKTADVAVAAKRVAFSKFMNAGQICLSANHVFVEPEVYGEFVENLVMWTEKFFGTGDMCKIVDKRNLDRLMGLVARTKGTVHRVTGCEEKTDELAMKPVVITDVDMDDAILEEELFGPICPVIKATVDEAIGFINSKPHPLALYVFSNDKEEVEKVLTSTLSGGVTINDTILHYMTPGAPFGGVGDSGHGYYHDIHGFLTFSHQRCIVNVPNWAEKLLVTRYPAYDITKMSTLDVKDRHGIQRGETLEDQVDWEKGFWRELTGLFGLRRRLRVSRAIKKRAVGKM